MYIPYKETAVLGAGICGRLIALRLALSGHRVTLFESHGLHSKTQCSAAAAGMLSPIAEVAYGDTDLLELGLESLNMWRDLGQQLFHSDFEGSSEQDLDQEKQFGRNKNLYDYEMRPKISFNGTLIVAHEQNASELREFQSRIDQKMGKFPVSLINQKELFELEPHLSETFHGGLYLPQEGHVNTWAILDQLAENLETAGVILRDHSHVLHVEPGFVTFHDREEFRKSIHFDMVFDCRGMGAKKDIPGLRGVRGESLVLKLPRNSPERFGLNRPVRILHPRYPIYIVPRTSDIIVVGATMIESESTEPVTVQSALEMMTALYHAHPSFHDASILDTMAALRPTLPHHHPRIFAQSGLIRVNGLFRHGFLLAPVVAKAAVSYFHGEALVGRQKELIIEGIKEE